MKVSGEVLRYLKLKGIENMEAQRKFLFPRLSDHYDPFLLKGMREAVDELKTAVKHQKKMLVWGDADLDGIASSVLLKSALNDLGAKTVEVRIPTRDNIGFGMVAEEVSRFKESGGDLIITVDVGVTNVEEAELARRLGLGLIITDHHELLGELPPAILIDPKQPDCTYPFRELAGAGVVFKLVSALYRSMVGLSVEELAGLRPHYWMFAALGTVSDRCPLLDENRLIVREGLARFEEGGWPSLEIWLEEMGLDAANLTVFDIYSRGISPFYSTDPEEVVQLLLSRDNEWMRSQYEVLKDRAAIWQRGKQQMIAEAERTAQYIGGIVVSVPERIDPTYLGTAAHALREQHAKHAIVLAPKGETWRAECRGLEQADLLHYLAQFSSMFLTFGGHRKACGFTLNPDALDDFLSALKTRPIESSSAEMVEDEPVFGLSLSKDLKDWALLAPFGEGNPSPRLLAHDIKIKESQTGFEIEGIPVFIPLSLKPLTQSNGRFDMEYTVKADGSIRVLNLAPCS
ncbi:DHH family phosphoesterase [candidate division WOR-3 bacterium]|nr:DHH family phosphoesterase [candidate division WOR-3 bacterium]